MKEGMQPPQTASSEGQQRPPHSFGQEPQAAPDFKKRFTIVDRGHSLNVEPATSKKLEPRGLQAFIDPLTGELRVVWHSGGRRDAQIGTRINLKSKTAKVEAHFAARKGTRLGGEVIFDPKKKQTRVEGIVHHDIKKHAVVGRSHVIFERRAKPIPTRIAA